MIRLTDSIVAIEVTSDCTFAKVGTDLSIINLYDNNGHIGQEVVPFNYLKLVGVTPLREDQWDEILPHGLLGGDKKYRNFLASADSWEDGYDLKDTAIESSESLFMNNNIDMSKTYLILIIDGEL